MMTVIKHFIDRWLISKHKKAEYIYLDGISLSGIWCNSSTESDFISRLRDAYYCSKQTVEQTLHWHQRMQPLTTNVNMKDDIIMRREKPVLPGDGKQQVSYYGPLPES